MYHQKRVSFVKWTSLILGVIFLSQCIAKWKAFLILPNFQIYFILLTLLTIFLLLILTIGITVYAEEKMKGALNRERPFFERWANRLFLVRQHEVNQ
ncbi:MAG: hypothetical protein ACKN9J_03580 [Holophagaceae bacterium]|jgi:hypothetical protein